MIIDQNFETFEQRDINESTLQEPMTSTENQQQDYNKLSFPTEQSKMIYNLKETLSGQHTFSPISGFKNDRRGVDTLTSMGLS
jgi:hypothetical protein